MLSTAEGARLCCTHPAGCQAATFFRMKYQRVQVQRVQLRLQVQQVFQLLQV